MRSPRPQHTKSLVIVSMLLSGLAAPAAWPATPKAAADAAGSATGAIQVSMRDVVLYPYGDVPAAVANLSGRVLAEHPPKQIVMDDLSSYRIETDSAEVRLTAEGMTQLMNRHILPGGRTPIHEVKVRYHVATATTPLFQGAGSSGYHPKA